MLTFYEQKYDDGSVFMVQKSLTYFDDADVQQEPQMFLNFDWDACKQKILYEVINL